MSKLADDINAILNLKDLGTTPEVVQQYLSRLSEGSLTRDENNETHFLFILQLLIQKLTEFLLDIIKNQDCGYLMEVTLIRMKQPDKL